MGKKKVKKQKRKWLYRVLIVVICILGLGGAFLYKAYEALDKTTRVEVDKSDLSIDSDALSKYANSDDITNIALFGVDSEEDEVGRTDAIVVLTLDNQHKKIKITSIMRDSYVSIEDYGYDKINHAYAYGGVQLAIKTINQNFGLDIENYALVNFDSMPKIIDALGGVDIEVTEEEMEYINGYIYSINQLEGTNADFVDCAGYKHLDGVQALAYSRIRYTSGGDYQRTQRQRTVLSALFDTAMNLPQTSYLSTLNAILPLIQTNLSSNEILTLGVSTLDLIGSPELEQERFPLDSTCEDAYIDGVYYLAFDNEYNKQKMMDYIFDDVEPTVEDDYIANINDGSYDSSYDGTAGAGYYGGYDDSGYDDSGYDPSVEGYDDSNGYGGQ